MKYCFAILYVNVAFQITVPFVMTFILALPHFSKVEVSIKKDWTLQQAVVSPDLEGYQHVEEKLCGL